MLDRILVEPKSEIQEGMAVHERQVSWGTNIAFQQGKARCI
jgi:hypothetical protein